MPVIVVINLHLSSPSFFTKASSFCKRLFISSKFNLKTSESLLRRHFHSLTFKDCSYSFCLIMFRKKSFRAPGSLFFKCLVLHWWDERRYSRRCFLIWSAPFAFLVFFDVGTVKGKSPVCYSNERIKVNSQSNSVLICRRREAAPPSDS